MRPPVFQTSPIRLLCLVGLLLLTMGERALALGTPKTQTRLLLSAETVKPGDTLWVGLQMDMPPGWHTYWRNGGDAGQATEIQWTLPAGVTAGQIQWPVPVKETDGMGEFALYTYVYTNTVVLLTELKVDGSFVPGPLMLTAKANWMECSDICVNTGNTLLAGLTVGAETKPSAAAAQLDQWRAKLPQAGASGEASAHWEEAAVKTNSRALILEWKTNVSGADYFPYLDTNFDIGGVTERIADSGETIRLRKIVKTNSTEWPKQITGLLVGGEGAGRFGVEETLAINAPSLAASSTPSISATSHASLVAMLFFAFVGGLILNIMPCVLPVIALKVLGFVGQAKEEPARVRKLGLVYGVGVLASFLVLALLAIGAQQAGGVAGWGDALRNPRVQIVLTVVMTLVALNLFGVFEIILGGKALGAANDLSGRAGYSGAFFNGILATVLATPCTAPFLGVALAFAFTQSPAVIMAVFLAAGLGLAAPFVLVCLNPALLKFLPKPGAWMERFKTAMGFPMLTTAVWLLWVSSAKEDDQFWLAMFLVDIGLVAWIWGQFVQRGTRRKPLAIFVCLILLVAGYEYILEGQLQWRAPAGAKTSSIDWKIWSPEAVEQARREGHPVLVDFTAKSCLTCKLNLISSLEIDATRAKLKAIGAIAFTADDTREDARISDVLRRYGAAGVPLVLVFPKDISQEPQVLPTFLTPSIVAAALDKAAK